jgi:phosphate transport system permease protein
MSSADFKATSGILPDFTSPAAIRRRRMRALRDVLTRHLMAIGGVSVILAIVLIAFYLVYVVLPMFLPAKLNRLSAYPVPGSGETWHYAMEEQHEIGLRINTRGEAIFFKTDTATVIDQIPVYPDAGAEPVAFAAGDPAQALLALAYADGAIVLARHEYQVSYPGDRRLITPAITLPFGSEPVQITDDGVAIRKLAAQGNAGKATIAAVDDLGRLRLVSLASKESMLTGETTLTRTDSEIIPEQPVTHLAMDVDQRELYLADRDGFLSFYDIGDKRAPRLVQRIQAVPPGTAITSLAFLNGGISILVGDAEGGITQWFPVRDEANNYTLSRIRQFASQQAPIMAIVPEHQRKGFLALDADGLLGLYHTTSQRTLRVEKIGEERLTHGAIAPRADALLVERGDMGLEFWQVQNPHPEISWRSLWGKVWYESRAKPEYVWQSSSASSEFEPKFSLTPLAFGTLKAAFYAMLFAMPLAIMGAIYTGYFMAPRMRGMVKPAIEVMAALPTVVLGFIAGLWFAPFVENHLPGICLLFIFLPLAILGAAWCWDHAPDRLRNRIPAGWEAALLIPVILIAIGLAIGVSQPLELLLFQGSMPQWLNETFGISFDQRNSLVVGVAIGFAVIPIIFSISEDAIYGVPRSLTGGSLALGATPWQTLVRVILLTASPGIFSAIMIGLGRAVGETMIVVMATGNTAVMEMNIFQGFRALSANIAVEMPEAEVAGTHYRILFLAALVLFAVTFVFNTLAEVVRQRLRRKYGSL